VYVPPVNEKLGGLLLTELVTVMSDEPVLVISKVAEKNAAVDPPTKTVPEVAAICVLFTPKLFAKLEKLIVRH
jgi:hypothetical protein